MKKYVVLFGLLAVLSSSLFAQEDYLDRMVFIDRAATKAYLEQVEKLKKYDLQGIDSAFYQRIINTIESNHSSVVSVTNLGTINHLYAQSVETPSETFLSYYLLVVAKNRQSAYDYFFYQVDVYHRSGWGDSLYELTNPRLLNSQTDIQELPADLAQTLKQKLARLQSSISQFHSPLNFAEKTVALPLLQLYPLTSIKGIKSVDTLSMDPAQDECDRDIYQVAITLEMENATTKSHVLLVEKEGPSKGHLWHFSAPRVSLPAGK